MQASLTKHNNILTHCLVYCNAVPPLFTFLLYLVEPCCPGCSSVHNQLITYAHTTLTYIIIVFNSLIALFIVCTLPSAMPHRPAVYRDPTRAHIHPLFLSHSASHPHSPSLTLTHPHSLTLTHNHSLTITHSLRCSVAAAAGVMVLNVMNW